MTFSIQWLASLAPIWFSFSEVSLIHTECCAALLSHPPENCSLMYGLPPLCKTTYPNPAPLSLWNCFLAMHCAQTKNGLLKTTFLPQVVVWNSLPHVDLPDSIQLRFDRETKSLDFSGHLWWPHEVRGDSWAPLCCPCLTDSSRHRMTKGNPQVTQTDGLISFRLTLKAIVHFG